MTAIEMADRLDTPLGFEEAAAMLRKQDAVIKQLREALIDCLDDSREAVGNYEVTYGEHFRPQRLAAMRKTVADAEAALAATEEFK
jgi:hypothetical protein